MGNCLALCIPRRCSGSPVSETGDGGAESRASSCIADKEQLAAGVTRIKLVITKQQLQDLLRKQVSVEEVVAGVENRAFCSATAWKPKLESIPEGSDALFERNLFRDPNVYEGYLEQGQVQMKQSEHFPLQKKRVDKKKITEGRGIKWEPSGSPIDGGSLRALSDRHVNGGILLVAGGGLGPHRWEPRSSLVQGTTGGTLFSIELGSRRKENTAGAKCSS